MAGLVPATRDLNPTQQSKSAIQVSRQGVDARHRAELDAKLLGGELFRLGDPAFDAGRQADFLADLLGIRPAKLGELPVVENAEIVELLFDRRRDMRQLLQVVRDAARS